MYKYCAYRPILKEKVFLTKFIVCVYHYNSFLVVSSYLLLHTPHRSPSPSPSLSISSPPSHSHTQPVGSGPSPIHNPRQEAYQMRMASSLTTNQSAASSLKDQLKRSSFGS